MHHTLQRYPLTCFYLLAFAITWSIWLPAAMATAGLLPFHIPIVLDGAAYFVGPPLAAGIVLYANGGWAAVGGLLGRLRDWRVDRGCYIFALLWRPAIYAAGLTLLAALGAGSPALDPWYLLLPRFLLYTLAGLVSYIGEEIGWRGFALPRLQAHMSLLAAGCVTGLLAGIWHLPAFFIAGHPQYGTPILPFMAWMVLLGVVVAWLFNRSGGSLLPVVLQHAAINGMGATLPPLPQAIEIIVTLVVVLALVILERQVLIRRSRNSVARVVQ
jgi:uncharacterized protein